MAPAAATASNSHTPWAERSRLLLLTAALGVGVLLSLFDDDRVAALVIGLVTAAGLHLSRRRPVIGAIAAAVVATVLAIFVGEDLAMLPLVSYACFFLAHDEAPSTSVPVNLAIAVALGLAVPFLDRERLEPLTVLGVLSIVLVPLLLGVVLRLQRQALQAQIEAATATRLEQERQAIARDLHDIVAHGLTAVAIQSGTAVHLFDSKPEGARAALANVNDAARAALAELRAMVGELRTPEASSPKGAEDPVREAMQRVAPTLDVSIEGDSLPATTPNTVRVAIERVVGEALANVIAHGGRGPTRVSMQVADDRLRLEIDNSQGSASPVQGTTGFGIMGMSERMSALGGSLHAEPRPGGFTVVATIPRREW